MTKVVTKRMNHPDNVNSVFAGNDEVRCVEIFKFDSCKGRVSFSMCRKIQKLSKSLENTHVHVPS